MRLETILNKCHRHKSFVYQSCRFEVVDGKESIVIGLVPRKNGLVICSKCQERAPIYDKLSTRRFTFVPLWGIPVYFEYQMRRVTCSKHDVTVEYIPWGDGKSNITKVFGFFG